MGSDNKFSIVFTVHQDEFNAGKVNWICAKDSESAGDGNRYSSDVDGFEVKDSLSITPASRGLRRGSYPQAERLHVF